MKNYFGEAYCLAEADCGVIGVAGLEKYGEFGLIRSLSVLHMWRWKSIGSNLFNNRIEYARNLNLKKVFLFTFDRTDYFERFGFRVINRDDMPLDIKKSEEHMYICLDAFAMEKEL